MGGGSSAPPAPPKFQPIDVWQTELAALDQSKTQYSESDNLFGQMYPGLVSARQSDIANAYKQLTGPLPPELEGAFTKNALGRTASVVGGGDPMSGLGLTKGSFGRG